jgi:hypothetical protein
MDMNGYQTSNRVFQISDGEYHFVVAASADLALFAHGVTDMAFQSVQEYQEEMWPVVILELPADRYISVESATGEAKLEQAWYWAITATGVFCSSAW